MKPPTMLLVTLCFVLGIMCLLLGTYGTAAGGGDGMSGILNGGWNFVVAAYLVSAAILTIYSIHAVTEFRRRTKGISQ
jgi:uncharacterized membrane protein (DUF485 family)